MARLYAQFGAIVFLAVGLGGLLTGDAGTLVHHQPQGNFGPVALHLTYLRDVLDLIVAAALGFAGFRASDRVAGGIVLAAGVVLILLALVGFDNPDNAAATRSVAGLHFTMPMNIFDAVTGALAILCGVGERQQAESGSVSSASESR